MLNDDKWNIFINSGKISDYLDYSQLLREERAGLERKNEGNSLERNSYKGK